MGQQRKSVLEFTAAELEAYGGMDNVPVSLTELALIMRCSPKTISRHISQENYCPEFGRRTTVGHYKAWLRERVKARGIALAREILKFN